MTSALVAMHHSVCAPQRQRDLMARLKITADLSLRCPMNASPSQMLLRRQSGLRCVLAVSLREHQSLFEPKSHPF